MSLVVIYAAGILHVDVVEAVITVVKFGRGFPGAEPENFFADEPTAEQTGRVTRSSRSQLQSSQQRSIAV